MILTAFGGARSASLTSYPHMQQFGHEMNGLVRICGASRCRGVGGGSRLEAAVGVGGRAVSQLGK
jgi:hypothetical protein